MLALGYVTRYSGLTRRWVWHSPKLERFIPFLGPLLGMVGSRGSPDRIRLQLFVWQFANDCREKSGPQPGVNAAANSSGGVIGQDD